MIYLRAASLEDIPSLQDTAVTVGSFDGVHRGHISVLERLCADAAKHDLSSVVITFEPHHRLFFGRESEPFLLTDVDEKLALMTDSCVDRALVLPFDRDLAGMHAVEFVRRILSERLGAKRLLIGHDQAIGRDQVRGPDSIRRLVNQTGVEVVTCEPVNVQGNVVSSTRARTALKQGDFELAVDLLGHPYPITGRVIHGDARGRELGYPTANISLRESHKLLPAPGVYVATADVITPPDNGAISPATGSVRGMLYIGSRPTFGDGNTVIEFFVLDWSGDLYGATLRIQVHKRLRGDMQFAGPSELIEQIKRDEELTRSSLDSDLKMV
jgi:riboflavin kinase / FMN adenylyltransferase